MMSIRSILAVALILVLLEVVHAGVLLRTKYQGSMNTGLMYKFGKLATMASANDVPEQWYKQKLDHFDAQNTEIWKQRYFVNDQYYKRGGPVFFIIGGEGPLSAAYVQTRFATTNYAQSFGGLLVALEHRFYGKSMPKPDLSTQNLKYLSSQQALADAAVFREFLVQEFNLPEGTKFIAVGGSYPGNLAAWARSKYPHLFDIGYGTSAPVLAVENFPGYMDVVADSLGPQCNSRVRQATDSIEVMLATPVGRAKLQTMFNTCKPISSDDDVVTFLSSITEGICETVQYNLDNNGLGTKWNVSAICTIIQDGNDAVQGLANFVNYWAEQNGEQCTMSNYNDYLAQLKDVRPWEQNENAAGRAWTYQTCTEFGYYQSAEGRKQPFSEKITIDWFVKQCAQIFGIPNMRPDIAFTNAYYGEKNLYSSKSLLPNGSIDPWHVLGILENPKHEDIHPFFMRGTAHCADLYAPRSTDLPTLTNTRTQIVAKLSQWLNQPAN